MPNGGGFSALPSQYKGAPNEERREGRKKGVGYDDPSVLPAAIRLAL